MYRKHLKHKGSHIPFLLPEGNTLPIEISYKKKKKKLPRPVMRDGGGAYVGVRATRVERILSILIGMRQGRVFFFLPTSHHITSRAGEDRRERKLGSYFSEWSMYDTCNVEAVRGGFKKNKNDLTL